MELKKYQQNVIDDLEAFLRVLEDSISLNARPFSAGSR